MPQLGALAVAVDRMVRILTHIPGLHYNNILIDDPACLCVLTSQAQTRASNTQCTPTPCCSHTCWRCSNHVTCAIRIAVDVCGEGGPTIVQESAKPVEVLGAAAAVRPAGAAATARACGRPPLLVVAGRVMHGLGPQRTAEATSGQPELAALLMARRSASTGDDVQR